MSVYDNVNCDELSKYAKQAGLGGKIPADFLQYIKYIGKNDVVLEVGCGTGRLGRLLIRKCNYVGIDQHKPYLDCFENYLKKNKLKNIDNILILSPFESYTGTDFNIIIFPWTVIGDFGKKEQLKIIKKSASMLRLGGTILIDNPAKGTEYNTENAYTPCKFYFDDWRCRLTKIFSKSKMVLYKTPTGRIRELTILEK